MIRRELLVLASILGVNTWELKDTDKIREACKKAQKKGKGGSEKSENKKEKKSKDKKSKKKKSKK